MHSLLRHTHTAMKKQDMDDDYAERDISVKNSKTDMDTEENNLVKNSVEETGPSGGFSNSTINAALEDGPFPGHTYSAKDVDKLVTTSTKLAGLTSDDPEHSAESKEVTRALLPFYMDKQLNLDEKSPVTSELPSSSIAVGDYKSQEVHSQPDKGQSTSRPVCGTSATSEEEGKNFPPSKDRALLYLYQMLCEASREFKQKNAELLEKVRKLRNNMGHPNVNKITDGEFDKILHILSKDGDILTQDDVKTLRDQFWEEFKIKVGKNCKQKHRS